VNVSPVLALAGLITIGLLATRLPRPQWRHVASLDRVLVTGGPFVLLGLVLGPGIDLVSPPVLEALAPVTALGIGWIGATLGARFEWRYLRRIPRGAWLLAALASVAVFAAVALAAWLLTSVVPALATAWTPRRPAVLTLAAVAAASGPGAVARVARAMGIRKSVAHMLALAATLETACGALAMTVPLALHGPHPPGGSAVLGWLSWIVFAAASGTLVGLVFLALTRLRPAPADLAFALLATLLCGAGIGYAAELSPFVVCALATALIVNTSPARRAARRVLAEWEHPLYAILLVVAGALLTLPTAGILVAVPLLAGVRAAATWAAARYGRLALGLAGVPPHIGLGTIAQDGAAVALALNFFIIYGDPGGAVLTTIVLGVVTAQLMAPPLMALALRAGSGGPAAPLTQPAQRPELSANAPAEWLR